MQSTSVTSQEVVCLTASFKQERAQVGISARVWPRARVAMAREIAAVNFILNVVDWSNKNDCMIPKGLSSS